MKYSILFLIFLITFCNSVTAQRQINFFSNAQNIDEDRYEGIKGSPYFFEEWQKATIIDENDSAYYDILMNYNAFEEDFEAKSGDKFIALDEKHYKRIIFDTKDGQVIFEKNLHPNSKNKFYQLIFAGDKLTGFMNYSVKVAENIIQSVGKTIVQKRFAADNMYYFILDGKLSTFRINKKKIKKLLGHEKQIEAFIKKNKLNVKSSFDLAKIMAYYESELI